MAKDPSLFWGHGASTGAAAGGGAGEEAEGSETEPSATCFVSLNILLWVKATVRQETFIFMMNVQNQWCEFLKFLIKKRVDVFYKGWLVFFATRVGRSYVQLEKAIYNLKK